jgi:hypothetical protein
MMEEERLLTKNAQDQCAVSRCSESPSERAEGSYQDPSNASSLPEMSRKVKGTQSRGEKRREEKLGIQDATASVG